MSFAVFRFLAVNLAISALATLLFAIFEGSVRVRDGHVYPSIKGSAFVNAEAELVLDSQDPFCMGIRA